MDANDLKIISIHLLMFSSHIHLNKLYCLSGSDKSGARMGCSQVSIRLVLRPGDAAHPTTHTHRLAPASSSMIPVQIALQLAYYQIGWPPTGRKPVMGRKLGIP